MLARTFPPSGQSPTAKPSSDLAWRLCPFPVPCGFAEPPIRAYARVRISSAPTRQRHALKFHNRGLQLIVGFNFGLPSFDRDPSLRYRTAANRWLVMIGPRGLPRPTHHNQDLDHETRTQRCFKLACTGRISQEPLRTRARHGRIGTHTRRCVQRPYACPDRAG